MTARENGYDDAKTPPDPGSDDDTVSGGSADQPHDDPDRDPDSPPEEATPEADRPVDNPSG
jgi:hypothetical protein